MTRTSYQVHARIQKKIINLDAGDGHAIVCCWSDCDRPGYAMYTHVFCEHDPGEPCERADTRLLGQAGRVAHLKFAFCSAGHLDYHRASEGGQALANIADTGRAYGNHTPGSRGRYG